MATSPEIVSFHSRASMAERVADLLQVVASGAIACDGVAAIAVSGGSTPEALYEAFARRVMPWGAVRLTLVDERWVSFDHPRSNERFVKRSFSKAQGISIGGLYSDTDGPAAASAELSKTHRMSGKPFDLVVLGMGEDGHTASWFPHAEGLKAALEGDDQFCAITARRSDITGEETKRITLSLSAVAQSKMVVLMIAGDKKRAVLEEALGTGAREDMPVRAILRARPDMWICWAP